MSSLLEKLIGSAALKDNPLKCLCIKLKPGSVTTDKIADKAVTPAKLSDSVKTDLIQTPINAVRENLQLSISEVQESLEDHASNTTKHITAQERNTWNSKQDVLTFDNTPTANSDNPVKSKGIKGYIDTAIEALHSLFSTKKIVFHPYSSSEEGDVETGYIEGYTEYSTGSGLKKGIRIKGYSDYNQGKSEISLTEDEGDSGSTYAKIDAGEVSINAGERASINLTDPTITFDGNPATVNTNGVTVFAGDISSTAGAAVNIDRSGEVNVVASKTTYINGNNNVRISCGETVGSDNGIFIDGDHNKVAIHGNPVTINGEDVDTIKDNAQNALNKINAMHPGQDTGMQIETPGIYYAYSEIRNPELIPSSMNHGAFTGYLLLVTHVAEIDVHGGYRHLHQLIIDIVTGRKATRMINYPYDSTIDWSTAPNFTEV